MKNASLFLALLVGLFSAHADSGEKNIIVPAAAETPDRCWCEYSAANSEIPEENTSYDMEEVAPYMEKAMNHIQAFDCENCPHQIAGNGHKFLGLDGLGGILMCPEFIPAPDSSRNSGCIAHADVGDEKALPD